MSIKAVIFDLDGTVIDTEKLLVKYWCMAANEFGFPMEREHALQLRSLARKYAEPLLKEWFGENCDYMTVRNRRMELMTAHIIENGLDVKAGIKELLVWLGENGYKRAVATGYNGAPVGLPHCEENGGCLRQQLGVPSGQRHELCRALHAEQNAIIQAASMGHAIEGGTIYITHQPCVICAKMIVNAGIKRIVVKEGYPDELAVEILDEATLEKLAE